MLLDFQQFLTKFETIAETRFVHVYLDFESSPFIRI